MSKTRFVNHHPAQANSGSLKGDQRHQAKKCSLEEEEEETAKEIPAPTKKTEATKVPKKATTSPREATIPTASMKVKEAEN